MILKQNRDKAIVDALKNNDLSAFENRWEDHASRAVDSLFLFVKYSYLNGINKQWDSWVNKNKNNPYWDSCAIDVSEDFLLNIKNAVNWYIDTQSWKHDPAYMTENQPGRVLEQCRTLHSSMWMMIGGSAIYYCLVNDIDITPESLTNTLIKKQKDYGPNNISRFGLNGLVIRTHDKVARIYNLLSKSGGLSNAVENESFYDTLLDIGGYAAIALMWNEGTFLTKMREDS